MLAPNRGSSETGTIWNRWDMSLHMELFAMLSVIIQHRCGPLVLRVGLSSVNWMNVLLILETVEILDPYRRLFNY